MKVFQSVMAALAVAMLVVTLASPAQAKKHIAAPHPVASCQPDNSGRTLCNVGFSTHSVWAEKSTRVSIRTSARDTEIIGGRPAGCPSRYCGCGLRKFLGIEDARLNLAWNWARLFPREPSPRPGLAAVRRGHVMYIEASAGDGQWLIRDYNSGGGLSRLHVRDVRGYVFVNPRSSMAANDGLSLHH
jgi:hypothetical protein